MSYNYEPTQLIPSRTLPGVSFVVRKMSEAERASFRLQQAEAFALMQDLNEEKEQLETAPLESRNSKRILAITNETQKIIVEQIHPNWLKWGLISVDGLSIANVPATAADIVAAKGPSEFYGEVLGTIKHVAELTETELKNFVSHIISGTPVDTATNDTTAQSASGPDTSVLETAASTLQIE